VCVCAYIPLFIIVTHAHHPNPASANETDQGVPSAIATVQQINVYNALQIVGFLLLAIVLFTALMSHNVRRTPTWFGMIAAWMFFAFSHLLLIRQQLGSHPPWGICLIQAGLIHTAPVLYVYLDIVRIGSGLILKS
jgi:hypothetical protein